MRYFLISLFSLLVTLDSHCQDTRQEMAVYNIGLGSLAGGAGALLHKKSNEKFGKVLLKGLAQGALGGYFVHESKNLVGRISSSGRLEYGWGAKFTNAIGTSIIENASQNRDFWEKWNLHIGFNRLEFYTKEKFSVKYRIMPFSLFFTAYTAFGNKFEISKSLQLGEIIYSGKPTGPTVQGVVAGATWANVIELNSLSVNDASIISHELIHVFQYYDLNYFNSFISKPIKNLSESSNSFRKFNSIFYLDAQLPVFGGLYLLENINRKNYYDNFFENEAGVYSNTLE